MKKYLIINADDFGICKETNLAIKELFEEGLITSTSLLATAEASEEAIEIIKKSNGINFGVHLTLNSDFLEFPWKAAHIGKSSLTDEEGYLFYDQKRIAKEAKSKDVTRECEAQISYIKSKGIFPDHLDNHCGTMYGLNMRLFFINAFKLAKRYDLPFRFPRKNDFLNDFFKNGVPKYVVLAHKAITFTSKVCGARIIDQMISNPFSIKDIPSYEELEKYYIQEIRKIKPGITELFLHPSYNCEKFLAVTPEWLKREYELKFLRSENFKKVISDEGIEIVSYKHVE